MSECKICNGTGMVHPKNAFSCRCEACDGWGRVSEPESGDPPPGTGGEGSNPRLIPGEGGKGRGPIS